MVRKWSYLNLRLNSEYIVHSRFNKVRLRYRFRIFKNTTKIRSKKFTFSSKTKLKRQKLKWRRDRHRSSLFNQLFVMRSWERALRGTKRLWGFYGNLHILPYFSASQSLKRMKRLYFRTNTKAIVGFITFSKHTLHIMQKYIPTNLPTFTTFFHSRQLYRLCLFTTDYLISNRKPLNLIGASSSATFFDANRLLSSFTDPKPTALQYASVHILSIQRLLSVTNNLLLLIRNIMITTIQHNLFLP